MSDLTLNLFQVMLGLGAVVSPGLHLKSILNPLRVVFPSTNRDLTSILSVFVVRPSRPT